MIAPGDGPGRQTVALCPQDDGKLGEPGKLRCKDRQALVCQRHGSGLKAQAPQQRLGPRGPGNVTLQNRPRDLEYRPHTHPDSPAVQGIAAPSAEQHRIDP